jgi:hypothetical protein
MLLGEQRFKKHTKKKDWGGGGGEEFLGGNFFSIKLQFHEKNKIILIFTTT